MFSDLQLLKICHSKIPEFLKEIQPRLLIQTLIVKVLKNKKIQIQFLFKLMSLLYKLRRLSTNQTN